MAKKLHALSLAMLAAGTFMAAPASAQSVEDRLTRIEQRLDVLEVKVDSGTATAADVQEIRSMRSSLSATETRQEQLEQRVSATETAAATPQQGFSNGSTKFSVGGYIKVDAIASRTSGGQIGGDTIQRDFLIPSTVPIGGVASGWDTDYSARQSRIQLKGETDLNGKKASGMIEVDFMATAGGDERITNSYTPRLRHAYINYDGWTFGQTWSNFQNVGALPDTLDFIGVTPGTVFVRQPQIKYSSGNFAISLEQPETTVTTGTGGRVVPGDDQLPDLVLRYNQGPITIAGIARQLSVSNDDFGTGKDSAIGYGVSVSGKFPVGAKDDIRLMATAGEGLGRYVGLNIINDAAIDPISGKLDPIASYSGFAAYRHIWNDQWRSTLAGSYFKADNPVILTGGSVTDESWNALANIIYSPHPKIDLGLEYMYVERSNESGQSGNLQKVQMSAKYSF